MSKRFEQQATGINSQANTVSFRSFQAQLDETVRVTTKARQQAHHDHLSAAKATTTTTPAAAVSPPTAALDRLELDDRERDEGEDGDVRSISDRLIEPTESSNTAIAALLDRSLTINHGELNLLLGPHNLSDKTLVSLFELPTVPVASVSGATASAAPEDGPSSPTLLLLPHMISTYLTTLQAIAAIINSKVSILVNPFLPSGLLSPAEGVGTGTETESSANEQSVTEHWRSKLALRVLVRRVPEGADELSEVRVAVVGNVDAGKSSLLGVLTKGRLDDGRGRARVSLFRHKHEVETGRTSSVGMELMGFTPLGQEVVPEGHAVAVLDNPNPPQGSFPRKQQLSWEEISAKAAKIISFADLAGHERYLKTTLFGLTATQPDFVLLIVGANAGLIGMSKEHLSVALALSVPVVCVVTKIDMTPPSILEQTLKQLAKVLRSPGCRKQPVFVKDVGMACELAANFVAEKACPIFLVSNVSGEGLPLLKTFLNMVPTGLDGRYPVDDDLEFSVSDVFSVPFVGTVVSGVILSGAVSVGDTVLIGPDSLGAFALTAIKSIQRKRVNVLHAEAGQSVSFALKRIKRAGVRKGMVILPKSEIAPTAVTRFEGQVLILYHNTLIAPRYQAMLHSGPVRQTVQIESIVDKACIRTGDRATVQFKFIKHAEHLKVGDRFLFREGRTKALGIVTKLLGKEM